MVFFLPCDHGLDFDISYVIFQSLRSILIKMGSESIERDDYAQEADPVRGICGAHRGHETAEVRDVRRTGGGRGLRGGQEKEWMACLMDDLR